MKTHNQECMEEQLSKAMTKWLAALEGQRKPHQPSRIRRHNNDQNYDV